MTRTIIYRYMGTNGIIESPVHLEDIYYTRFVRLVADDKKVLTDGVVRRQTVQVPEEEEKNWKEVEAWEIRPKPYLWFNLFFKNFRKKILLGKILVKIFPFYKIYRKDDRIEWLLLRVI